MSDELSPPRHGRAGCRRGTRDDDSRRHDRYDAAAGDDGHDGLAVDDDDGRGPSETAIGAGSVALVFPSAPTISMQPHQPTRKSRARARTGHFDDSCSRPKYYTQLPLLIYVAYSSTVRSALLYILFRSAIQAVLRSCFLQ